MEAVVIDGKEIAQKVRRSVAGKVQALKERGINPCLAVILVGEDPASISYVTGKRKALAEAGMLDKSVSLPGSVTEDELLKQIADLNADSSVHGILVQLPLPGHISEQKVINAISPEKDVDGFNPVNLGRLMTGEKSFVPCTPGGICVMLREAGVRTDGANVVIVGRSNIVGKPLALLLSRREFNATVTLCHTGTRNLSDYTKNADIVIAATGHPHTVTRDMVRPGACVIDVGVNRVPDSAKKSGFRLTGDTDFDDLRSVAGFITPVPGGVGPMTIAMLMQNTLEAAENAAVA